MITILTDKECTMFNLESNEKELDFKEFILNQKIDKSKKSIRLNIQLLDEYGNTEDKTKIKIKIKDIKRIIHEDRIFHYSTQKAIDNLLTRVNTQKGK